MPASRSPWGTQGTSVAEVWESPLANSVTSWPCATSSSVSQDTTRSVPPYSFGGTASANGATWAIRTIPSSQALSVNATKFPLAKNEQCTSLQGVAATLTG